MAHPGWKATSLKREGPFSGVGVVVELATRGRALGKGLSFLVLLWFIFCGV